MRHTLNAAMRQQFGAGLMGHNARGCIHSCMVGWPMPFHDRPAQGREIERMHVQGVWASLNRHVCWRRLASKMVLDLER